MNTNEQMIHDAMSAAKDVELRNVIADIMLAPRVADFIKRRQVADIVRQSFERAGFFCRTADNRLFYFDKRERRLYDLDARDFEYALSALTTLGKSESVYNFTLHSLKTAAARTAAVEVHTLAHFDSASGFLAVSDGRAGVWTRERAGDWTLRANGDDGLLFLTELDAQPFEPAFDSKNQLAWFLDRFLLAARDSLSIDDQKSLLLVNLLHSFFPALRRTRLIPAALGAMGSGKSTAARLLGRLLVGSNFEVALLRKEHEDAFVATICNRTVCGFDNADSRIPWLEDALATYATGQRYRLRRLYTTNDEVTFDPRAIIIITSRDPHFTRPDVAERLLPLYFERPTAYVAEPIIFDQLAQRRNEIWGELLTYLAVVADFVTENEAPPLAFRMADFAAFGWSVFALRNKQHEWIQLLARLERAQAGFAAQNDGIIEVLKTMLSEDGEIPPVATGELFARCRARAEAEGLAFPATAQGFGRRLTSMKRVIELELKCRFTETTAREGKRYITITSLSNE